MQVMTLLMLSLAGVGVVAALSAALYATLPRYFLECAELHGRFRGLREDKSAIANGTPAESLPGRPMGQPAPAGDSLAGRSVGRPMGQLDGVLSGQAA